MSAKDQLQIILITYNREMHLQRTFEQLFAENSPIKGYDILVLDNNSTDGTEAIVKELMEIHPNVNYKKNRRNVGISGNIAKAIEMAEKDYVWIICDDDRYDFSNWAEVEKAIENEEEAICVATFVISEENRNRDDFKLFQMTFLPSLIIKTSNFTNTVMQNVFDNIYALFPHLCAPISVVNQGKSIYLVEKAIVSNGMDIANTDCSYIRGQKSEELYQRTRTMNWIVGYVNLCSNIKDSELRRLTIANGIWGIYSDFPKLCDSVMSVYSDKKDWMHLMDLFVVFTDEQQKFFIDKLREKGLYSKMFEKEMV